MARKKADSQRFVIALLIAYGWQEDGATREETVRIPTIRSPVFGGVGGELRTFGGRARLRKGDRFVTVGPRLVCFYRRGPDGPSDFDRVPTKDARRIGELAQCEDEGD